MLKSFAHLALVGTLFASTAVFTASDAEARRGGKAAGIIAGTIIGLGVLGAYAASRERRHHYGYSHRECYPGRQICHVVGQRCWYNRYGEYRCRDKVQCHRPTVCH